MERREFIFSLASLPLIASIPKLSEFKRLDWDLRFEKYHDPLAFMPDKFKVIKGPYEYKSSSGYGQDLCDSHGLCATLGWAYIVREELEFGSDARKQIWDLGWDCDPVIREKLKNKLRRVEITNIEYAKIILFLHKLRGKCDCIFHNCSLNERQKLEKVLGQEGMTIL